MMALTERTQIDQIEIVHHWNVQVRQATIIEKDGEFVARTFHRWSLVPSMDISDQEPKVQAIARAAWTPEVIAAYQEHMAAQAAKMGVQP